MIEPDQTERGKEEGRRRMRREERSREGYPSVNWRRQHRAGTVGEEREKGEERKAKEKKKKKKVK